MRKGGGGKCPPIVFLEGANIHHYAFVEGAIILPCQLLGGQMSTHAIFHRGGGGGADVRGGKCPAPLGWSTIFITESVLHSDELLFKITLYVFFYNCVAIQNT